MVVSSDVSIRPGVIVDLHREGVWRRRRFHAIPARTFRIMVCLIEHRDHVVSQPALLTVGWPDEPRVGQDLYRHIHRIRQLIESDPDRPQWLLTRKDRGYVLVSALLGHTRRKKEQP